MEIFPSPCCRIYFQKEKKEKKSKKVRQPQLIKSGLPSSRRTKNDEVAMKKKKNEKTHSDDLTHTHTPLPQKRSSATPRWWRNPTPGFGFLSHHIINTRSTQKTCALCRICSVCKPLPEVWDHQPLNRQEEYAGVHI